MNCLFVVFESGTMGKKMAKKWEKVVNCGKK